MDSIDLIVPTGHHEVVITGKVLEKPTRSSGFETRASKLIGSIVDGRPYPVGPQSSVYNLRIAEAQATGFARQTNVLVFGEIYDGRIGADDFVQVVARENIRFPGALLGEARAGSIEYTALSITNSTPVVLDRNGDYVESTIRPAFTVSADVIRASFLVTLALAMMLLLWLLGGGIAFLLGAAIDLVGALVVLAGPSLVLLYGIYRLVKVVLP